MPETDQKSQLMIVEDDYFTLTTLEKKFGKGGIETACFDNGLKAIDYLKAGNIPRTILLDINVPGMNGMDILEWIKKDQRFVDTSVIVFTAVQDDTLKEKAQSLGVADFIFKAEVGISELFNTVTSLMPAK